MKEVLASLSEQAEAIKSVAAKINLIELYIKKQNNNQVTDGFVQQIEDLKELRNTLDYDLLDMQLLPQLYDDHKVWDRYALFLFD